MYCIYDTIMFCIIYTILYYISLFYIIYIRDNEIYYMIYESLLLFISIISNYCLCVCVLLKITSMQPHRPQSNHPYDQKIISSTWSYPPGHPEPGATGDFDTAPGSMHPGSRFCVLHDATTSMGRWLCWGMVVVWNHP